MSDLKNYELHLDMLEEPGGQVILPFRATGMTQAMTFADDLLEHLRSFRGLVVHAEES